LNKKTPCKNLIAIFPTVFQNFSPVRFFSVIIPVYNRPEEVAELLESLVQQAYRHLEILIIEDGSTLSSEAVVASFAQSLPIQYYQKPNSGPGDSRNFGAQRAKGDFFLFLDSDCLVPPGYFEAINFYLEQQPHIEAFGGPDRAHPAFSPVQKAINYAMTSRLTTGGIRGSKHYASAKFHPRSFNMGLSRAVFAHTKGFGKMRFGEDIDLSLRIQEGGFATALIPDAFVYHKRRTDFRKFFKQIYNSGIARINLYKLHPTSLKAIHFLPFVFVLMAVFWLLGGLLLQAPWWWWLPLPLGVAVVFFDALLYYRYTPQVALLAIPATLVQLGAYGLGFGQALWRRVLLGRASFQAFEKNFYK